MVAGPERFPNGAEHVVTLREELPSGQVHLELLLPDLTRRRFLLDYGQADETMIGEIAAAMRDNRRIVKGRQVGRP